jgi:hypothetical protein
LAHLTLGSTEKARLAYAETIEEFGTEEGARIGADDDLANLLQRRNPACRYGTHGIRTLLAE